jgi:hypothetical protein
MGDGATIKRMPLVDKLASSVNAPAAVLEIADCVGHIETGGKKACCLIARLCLKHFQRIDPNKRLIDVVWCGVL